jgi:ribose/xylose/arabinose/galactoside ABC-type transport system permease subunit
MSNSFTTRAAPNSPIGRIRLVARGGFGGYSNQIGLGALLVALVLLFSALLGNGFTNSANLLSIGLQLPELGILSLAIFITLIHGGMNLSAVATANLCALTAAHLLTTKIPGASETMQIVWMFIAVFAAIALGLLVGLLNGAIVVYAGVHPMLATVGTMIMIKGVALGFTHGAVISGFPAPIRFIGSGIFLGVPFGLIVFAVCAIAVAVILNRTPFGAAIYLIGSNERATEYSGVDTKRVLFGIYLLSSFLAVIAGLVMMGRFNSANATYGDSYILVTVLASMLGGTDPYGGFGTVSGLVLSLLILQVIASAFNQLHLSAFLTIAIWGLLLVGVSAVTVVKRRSRTASEAMR